MFIYIFKWAQTESFLELSFRNVLKTHLCPMYKWITSFLRELYFIRTLYGALFLQFTFNNIFMLLLFFCTIYFTAHIEICFNIGIHIYYSCAINSIVLGIVEDGVGQEWSYSIWGVSDIVNCIYKMDQQKTNFV